jgi:hypothetical protein
MTTPLNNDFLARIQDASLSQSLRELSYQVRLRTSSLKSYSDFILRVGKGSEVAVNAQNILRILIPGDTYIDQELVRATTQLAKKLDDEEAASPADLVALTSALDRFKQHLPALQHEVLQLSANGMNTPPLNELAQRVQQTLHSLYAEVEAINEVFVPRLTHTN